MYNECHVGVLFLFIYANEDEMNDDRLENVMKKINEISIPQRQYRN